MNLLVNQSAEPNLNLALRFSSARRFIAETMSVRVFVRTAALVLYLSVPLEASAMDQDFARLARAQGVTVPFQTMLARARTATGRDTKLLDATMFRQGARVVVEIYLKRPDGQLVTVQLDGRTNSVLDVRNPQSATAKSKPSGIAGFFSTLFGGGASGRIEKRHYQDAGNAGGSGGGRP